MSTDLQGGLQGQRLRIGIVVARFNGFVTSRLLEGARSALAQHGVPDDSVTVASVPGSFEIPLVAKKMAESARYDAVVCLGAVIRGETDHYEYIAGEAAKGISQAGLDAGVPVIFGVLTTDTVEQAIDRAGGENGRFGNGTLQVAAANPDAKLTGGGHRNVGYEAGVSAIEMANLVSSLDSA